MNNGDPDTIYDGVSLRPRLEHEIAIGRAPTKRYGELPDVKVTADVCPRCLSHNIGDFDRSEIGDTRPHRHCWDCGRVWRVGV